jgi:hypothetical protein
MYKTDLGDSFQKEFQLLESFESLGYNYVQKLCEKKPATTVCWQKTSPLSSTGEDVLNIMN